MALRTELEGVLRALLARPEASLDLDAIGDAIGMRAVSTADVEALFDALERGGKAVAADAARPGSVSKTLRAVLGAARELRTETGRAPPVHAIAARVGLSAVEVLAALRVGQIMGR